MKCRTLSIAAAMLLALPLLSLTAQQAPARSDLLVRIHGPVTVNAADSFGTVWVINNEVSVAGSVDELVVINGTARISGTVRGTVVLFGSTAIISPSAHVGKDVVLYRSTMNELPGVVAGSIHRESGATFGPQALWVLWTSITIALIVAGLAFGYFFSGFLARVADDARINWRKNFVVTVLIVCGLPLAAVLSFMTGVGFVLGLFIMFALIPALSLLGYVVAGTSIGRALLQIPQTSRAKMFGSIAIGIAVLQVMAVVPAIGVISVLLGSWFGAGALVHMAWQREKNETPTSKLIMQPA